MNNPVEPLKDTQSGKIIVCADEWTLSNTGFAQAPDTATFATNIAKWFTGGRGTGKFYAYSTNFGLTESVLAQTLTKAGYTWTVGKDIKIDLPTLLTFNGLFLCGDAADNQVLIDYVKAGGNVYIGAGTGVGGPQPEADRWNTFLGAFGLKLLGAYNGINGNQNINSSHPIFVGVKAIYQNNGSSIVKVDPASQTSQILLTHTSGQGLLAVAESETIKRSPQSTESLQTITLWQIGKPGKCGKDFLPLGGWSQDFTYTVGVDRDPVNESSMPFLLVKPGLAAKPEQAGKQLPSTEKLNIRFVLERNYNEGELILFYDFFGSEIDTLFLDGKILGQTFGVGEGKLKQNRIPLGALIKGEHTLTITTNEGNGSHWIDYLRLVSTGKNYTYSSRPVAFKAPNGQYLAAENGGGGSILANRSEVSTWEIFRLITLENGKVALQAPLKQEYLSALADGNLVWVNYIGEWEMFDLVQFGGNKVALKSYHGKYISIKQGGGGTVLANEPAIRESENFELIELESGKFIQKEKASQEEETEEGERKTANTIVLELGSQKKDDIQDFIKGRGRLLKKVARTISLLQESGEIDEDAQPVIAIVRQKRSGSRKLFD